MKHWYDRPQTELDRAYYERNALVAALSKLYPSHLAEHPDDPSWDPAWKFLVCIHTPAGQLTWHLHLAHIGEFAHLEFEDNHWDGHTTVEKYTRLASLCADSELEVASEAASVDTLGASKYDENR